MDRRISYLAEFAGFVGQAAHSGVLTGGKVCAVERAYTIVGPRAGAVELYVGLQAGNLLRALTRDDGATLRQLIPWDFAGEPQAFMSGRYLRLEAGWPDHLAEREVRLDHLGEYPVSEGRWGAGKSEYGATVRPGLNDATPHFLIAGATGSGKSVALRSAVLQLSRDPDNGFVLADGKGGESLKVLERLPGVIGPCATEGPEIRSALGWAAAEMRRCNGNGANGRRLVVVVDEFQELVQDEVIVDLLRKIAAQGRSRRVHLLAATQHPTVDAFGHSSTRRNLTGKCALRVADPDASRVAVGGGSPRADRLLGAGDAYLVAPGACHRVQLAYVDEGEIAQETNGGADWRFQRWPEFDGSDVGQELPEYGQFVYSGEELGTAIVAAVESEGRDLFTRRMDQAGLGAPGYKRQKRLRELGAGAHDALMRQGYFVAKRAPASARGLIPAVSVW